MTFLMLRVGYEAHQDRYGVTLVVLGFWIGVSREIERRGGQFNVHVASEWGGWRYWTSRT